jgi:hypothetical protein
MDSDKHTLLLANFKAELLRSREREHFVNAGKSCGYSRAGSIGHCQTRYDVYGPPNGSTSSDGRLMRIRSRGQ